MYHQGLTSIERVIIESIQKGHHELSAILADTQLNLGLVHHLVQNLIIKGILIQQDKAITLNPHMNKTLEKEVFTKTPSFQEKKEMAIGMIKNEGSIKLSKFYLTDKDKVIFKSLINQLNLFIDNLPEPPKSKNTADLTVMCWGTTSYHDLIQSILK